MSTLTRIYFVRGVIAIAWSGVFAALSGGGLSAAVVALLVLYPVIDAAATLLDLRSMTADTTRSLQVFNTSLSALAAIGLGFGTVGGTGVVLFVFGLWAIISGVAQVVVAVRRRAELGIQWASLLAGTLSVIAGTTYLPLALGPAPVLSMLVLYTGVGGVWFILQAITLVVRDRRRGTVAPAPARSASPS
jgi:uncharacterized membrane protein HdeD (DUF308 family)